MNLKALVSETASRADDILSGCTNPSEARSVLNDLLATEHPELTAPDRQNVTSQIMSILENEGFFETPGEGSAPIEGSDVDDHQEDE